MLFWVKTSKFTQATEFNLVFFLIIAVQDIWKAITNVTSVVFNAEEILFIKHINPQTVCWSITIFTSLSIEWS